MSNRSRHTRKRWQPCEEGPDHALERWCLEEAVKLGNVSAVGLHPEYVNGRLEGFWKLMRCGCVFCVLVVEA